MRAFIVKAHFRIQLFCYDNLNIIIEFVDALSVCFLKVTNDPKGGFNGVSILP